MHRFEIDAPARRAAFLAQLAHESGELRRWTENLNYRWQRLREVFPKYFRTDAEAQAFDRQPERIASRVYGSRMGNGPESSGDGWRYRGRGPIELTGKDNYRACGTAIGVDLVKEPEQLETPAVGCLAAAWFWASKGLNALADAGDFVSITRRINGGLIGLQERGEFWERAKEVFGVTAPAVAISRGLRSARGGAKPEPAGRRAGAGGKKPAKPGVRAISKAGPKAGKPRIAAANKKATSKPARRALSAVQRPMAKKRAGAAARPARAKGRGAKARPGSRGAASRKPPRPKR